MASDMLVIDFDDSNLKVNDLDRKTMRRYLRRAANLVVKDARKRVSSPAGTQYPARRTGALQRSISVRMFRRGLGVSIEHKKPKGADVYYPAILRYGVKNKDGSWRIKPRENYILDAAKAQQRSAMSVVMDGFSEAIKGVFEK